MRLFKRKPADKLDTSKGMPMGMFWGYDSRVWVYPEDILKELSKFMETHPDFKDKIKELFK